jgi:acyl dehydratase
MPINRDFLGRRFPPSEPYEVTRVKIREFADAIGDPSPLHRDPEAAKAAGYRDVVAPPTFLIVITLDAPALADPDLGLDYSRVVHTEQRFAHTRPVLAGDVVTCVSTITEIKTIAGNEKLGVETEIRTVEGELVCTSFSALVARGE